MRLIKPSWDILEQKELLSHIELCGRVCYKSEDKITSDSSGKFVDNLIKSGHLSVLEHGTIYLKIEDELVRGIQTCDEIFHKYKYNQYSVYNSSIINRGNKTLIGGYVTTNYRVLVENGWLDDLKYQCEPTDFHEKRLSVKFICDRGISHEFVRHRVFSFSQESTRYCNYSKDKFGNELTFIIPVWCSNIEAGQYDTISLKSKKDGEVVNAIEHIDSGKAWNISSSSEGCLLSSLLWNERYYFQLLHTWELLPQQARAVLPNSLKTELIMTGTISQWEGFFKLRDSGAAHPQARELAKPLHEEFIKRGWCK